MRVADLEGETLDLWVAKAEGYKLVADPEEIGNAALGQTAPVIFRNNEGRLAVAGPNLHGLWSPSKYWAHGGPIIERERIELSTNSDGTWVSFPLQRGPTPLVSAMRAYVASKFGEEVPDSAD